MEQNAQISSASQFVVGAGASPNVMARWLAADLNINALRTNDLLRKDEWKDLDETVVQVARARITAAQDLIDLGLVLDLGGLGTLLSEYEQQTDLTAANVDMAGVTPGEEDNVGFNLVSVPVPIIHKDFTINIRRLQASRKLGQTIDVATAAVAARKVRDGLEALVLNGNTGIVVNANGLYGYTTHPSRNTLTGDDWGTIANIYTNMLEAVALLEGDNYFGPYTLYVAKAQFGEMRAIHTDGSGETAYDRVLRGIPQIQSIKPADTLTAGTAVMIQMTRDVVDMAVGEDISPVEWNTLGGMMLHFKVMACMAPRVKSDADGQSGVCHISGI